eukprot:sb/3474011/
MNRMAFVNDCDQPRPSETIFHVLANYGLLRHQPYKFDVSVVKDDALPTLFLEDSEKLKKESLTKEQISMLDREELEQCGLGEFNEEWYPGLPDSDEESDSDSDSEGNSDSDSDSESEDESQDEIESENEDDGDSKRKRRKQKL